MYIIETLHAAERFQDWTLTCLVHLLMQWICYINLGYAVLGLI